MGLHAGARAGRYEVKAPLGAGGMGEVYRARDTVLDREVALKILPAAVAGDPAALARFRREARAAARLAHPGIVAIYDAGEDNGLAYLALELVDGRTLREALAAGPLPPDRALDVATQVARALAAAHAAGVVHRDLKPENVILSGDGRARLLDFGIATAPRLFDAGEAADDETVTRLTQPGAVVGTVGYMSPEQLGGRAVDGRSDQFALGVLLQEMLTGTAPFRRASAAETIGAILHQPAPALGHAEPGVAAIVARCLAKDPAARWADTAELADALDRVRGAPGRPASRPDVPARRPRALRALVAVGGLALVAAAVAVLVAVPWSRSRTGARAPAAPSGALAEGLYYAAKAEWAEQDRSIAPLEQATREHPDDVRAWSALAGQYARKVFASGDPDRAWERKAVDAIARALALDPTAPDALVARANLAYTRESGFPYERILADLRTVLARDPGNARAHASLGSVLMHAGLLDEALQHLRRAADLDPQEPFPYARIARTLWFGGHYAEALAAYQPHPDIARHAECALVLIHLGRDDDASRMLEGALGGRRGQREDALSVRSVLRARRGDRAGALADAAEAEGTGAHSTHFHHAAYNIAVAHALLGDRTEAVRWLERVADDGMPCEPLFARDPFLAGLRGDPGYDALLARLAAQRDRLRSLL